MDLLQLRYFQVVARVEHVTKAAEELSIAQPSLSKTIRRLEKEIGVPLFERLRCAGTARLPFCRLATNGRSSSLSYEK